MDEYNHSIQRLVSYFLDQLRTVNYHHMQQRENLEQRVALEGAGNAAKETALDAMTAQFERAKGVITAQRATIGKLCNELEEQQVLNHDELGKEAADEVVARQRLEQQISDQHSDITAKETAMNAMTAQFDRAQGVITAQRATIRKLCNELEEQQGLLKAEMKIVLEHSELARKLEHEEEDKRMTMLVKRNAKYHAHVRDRYIANTWLDRSWADEVVLDARDELDKMEKAMEWRRRRGRWRRRRRRG